jgi:hypothetical protein
LPSFGQPGWSAALDRIEAGSRRIVAASHGRRAAFGFAALCLAAIVWPFLIDANHLLYVRYFDAETYFDPVAKLQRTFSAWDFSQHLGAPTGRAMMYASLPSVLYAAFAFVGPNVLVRVTCIAGVAACFAAMLVYLRYAYEPRPSLAPRVCAALFFAANPYVVSLVHDGFVTLLGQYVLLPLSLAALEWGRRVNRPEVLFAVAAAFVLDSLYTVPLVAIDLAVILALQWPFVVSALRDRRTRTGLLLLALAQAYWAMPLAAGIAAHAGVERGAETAGDVNLTSTYASLANVVLLRSNPSIWTTGPLHVRECTACGYYASPLFVLPMLALVLAALFALYRERRIRLLAICGVALVLATSVRYAGEFIGLPYELLVNVPVLDSVFRGAVKFDQVTAFAYALGIASFFRSRDAGPYPFTAKTILALATVVVTAPLWTGGIIERGPHIRDPVAIERYVDPSWPVRPPQIVAFPNFPVDIPAAYGKLHDELTQVPQDQAVLVLPNQPFAAYAWGAYGNDFVPAILGHATLEATFVPEPNVAVDAALRNFSDPAFDADSAAAFLHVLRLGTIVFRADALGATSAPLGALGSVVHTDGPLTILRAPLPPIDTNQAAARPVQVAGNQESIVRFATFAGALTRSLDTDACPATDPIGYAEPTQTDSIDAYLPTGCDDPVRLIVSVAAASDVRAALSPAQNGRCATFTGPLERLPGTVARGILTASVPQRVDAHGTCLHVRFRGRFRYAALADDRGTIASATVRQDPARSPWPGIVLTNALPADSVRSYNVANDPAFAGILLSGGSFAGFARAFVPYTYANGFYVPAGDVLAIVNVAVLCAQAGAVISIVALGGLGFWFVALIVSRRRRART